ncbi:hypothetical protein SELMODRAFT_427425 [Selaginella moellendorffii]|uniref:Uncharacterized protein n=1 Tax=Selaginella moellendorffii TaxID=88036 RepID=D8SZJ6_SELML|nr:hypothetical protein SELMODRAFT_427425 [Selaginella moellendorffii]
MEALTDATSNMSKMQESARTIQACVLHSSKSRMAVYCKSHTPHRCTIVKAIFGFGILIYWMLKQKRNIADVIKENFCKEINQNLRLLIWSQDIMHGRLYQKLNREIQKCITRLSKAFHLTV